MNSIAVWFGASVMAVALAIYPQKSLAEGFTGVEFLGWSKTAQDSYFMTSVTMVAIMASKTRKIAGDCLANWYLADTADQSVRNAELKSAIERNTRYHPSAVIFLVLEQA